MVYGLIYACRIATESLFREFKGIEKRKAPSKREILLVLDVSQHMMHGM